MILANISNGLAFPHDDVCAFQSQHGHHAADGYFRIDAMPYGAVIHLLTGGRLTVVDATRRHKRWTDAQKFGVPTWCLVFNRALGARDTVVCDWQTPHMRLAANSDKHRPLVQSLRKLIRYYGPREPVAIGRDVLLECHQGFISDDNPRRLRRLIGAGA